MAADQVSFVASFPPIQAAIKIGQDGMRIQLEIAETEMPNAVELIMMRDCALQVTIQQYEADTRGL